MKFGNTFENWASFDVGCVSTLTKYALDWTISIVGTGFCMIRIPIINVARFVITVITCTSIILAVSALWRPILGFD